MATQSDSFYDEAYFDKPKDVVHESGYAGYTGQEPGIAAAVNIVTTHFRPRRVLDVGCAKGYVVDILRRRGIDVWGIDFSRYAIETAPASVKPYVAVGDATRIDFADNSFDLVICIETLEHLTIDRAQQAVAELYRVTSDKVWITTPVMGSNDFGPPDGWPQGKIREEILHRYLANRDFPDPAQIEDLMQDQRGYPIHGHLIAASYRWWTELFTRRGFVRCGEIERRMNRSEPVLAQALWNALVFEKPKVPEDGPEAQTRREAAVAALMEVPLSSEVGAPSAAPWDANDMACGVAADSQEGLLMRGPGRPLPPGRYKVEYTLGAQASDLISNEWTELAVLSVRSSGMSKIHALLTLRQRDFTAEGWHDFSLTFTSGGESDFEFCVWFSGPCSFYVKSRLSLSALP